MSSPRKWQELSVWPNLRAGPRSDGLLRFSDQRRVPCRRRAICAVSGTPLTRRCARNARTLSASLAGRAGPRPPRKAKRRFRCGSRPPNRNGPSFQGLTRLTRSDHGLTRV